MPSEAANEYIAGAVGGLAGLVIGHPCDTMKTITQNGVTGSTIGMRQLSMMMIRNGSETFFRGLSVPFWSYGVVNSVFFGTHKNLLKLLGVNVDAGGPEDEGWYHLSNNQCAMLAVSGSIAGASQMIPAVPGEVIKIRMQMDAHTAGDRPLVRKTMRTIYRESGMRGFYKGGTAYLLREVPATAFYFLSYEKGRRLLRRNTNLSPLTNSFIAGAFAGWLSWMITLPQDVIKTRIQSGLDKDISSCIKRLLSEGASSFYRGLGLVSIRALLFNGVAFWGYEVCIKHLN